MKKVLKRSSMKYKTKTYLTLNTQKLIDKALKAKKKQAALYRHQLEIKKKIAKIQEEVIKNIKKKREELRNKLLAMRRDSKRKERLAKLKMDKLRNQITKKLINASKKGNLQLCDPERPSNDIVQYCQNNYKDSYVKMNECVKNDNFCYMCCETEYGELHLEDRSVCYMKCDDFYINKIKFAKKSNPKVNRGGIGPQRGKGVGFGNGSRSIGSNEKLKENAICVNVDVTPSFERIPIIKEVHDSADEKLKKEVSEKIEHNHHFNFIGGRLNENEILITKFLQGKEKKKTSKSMNENSVNNSDVMTENHTKTLKNENSFEAFSPEVLVNADQAVDEQKKQLLLTIKNELSDIIIQ